jgi:DNA-binding IclR family transcriptional regulator
MNAKNPIQATQTTFRILEAVKELDGAGITELSNHLDLPKSTVHNYLSTLVQEEFVVKDRSTYHIGIRFLEYGSYARHRKPVYKTARPQIDALAEETGELANLLIEEHGRGIYIYRATGRDAVKVDAYTGQRVYLHNTALGKAILSEYPEERVREIVDRHGLPKATERTVTSEAELFEELERVRERGYAVDDEERLSGLKCLAVPIISDKEGVEGSISVSGPISRMQDERFEEEILKHIQNAVNIVELNLTHG